MSTNESGRPKWTKGGRDEPEGGVDVDSTALTGDHESPFPADPPTARATAEREAATEARLKRWAGCRFAVADLPTSAHLWARKLADKVERDNAFGTGSKPPTLFVAGDKAVTAGATDSQLAALTPLDTDALRALQLQAAGIAADVRNQVAEVARKLAVERSAADVQIVGRVNLAEYEPESTRWVVADLLARGAALGVFAERKAGKTTVVEELVHAALDGLPFLGKYPVTLPEGCGVVLFDTEMPTATLHTHYRQRGVVNLDRLDLRPLRGRERALDVRSDAVRARWCDEIEPGSLMVVDCLYTLFGALGVSENSDEVVEILAGLRALATEADAAALVLVHHLGKDTERGARGHSSIEGFPDAIVNIELDGPPASDTPRVLRAFGRDVEIEPGVLTLGDDHRLTIGGNPRVERVAAGHRADDNATWSLIEAHPGLSVRGLSTLPIEARGKLSRDRIRTAVDRLALTNRVTNKGTPAAPEWHAITPLDPFELPSIEGA
ncbi:MULTISPECIES: AAA family ATPase [Gordonia]|uniref:AAA family ATPase n=1 Tax=Gordonia TaxID=2053 RepID=UPI0019AF8579|nr:MULTISPECIES: AAA family ATPase [Gordonia]MBD0024035.1 AAA family ATPase [Gordonia sp. (in: high G+C Gram-positive bacteria)]